MSAELESYRPVPRWLHVWAILTVIATTPLIALGGLVTTKRAGMADPVWPTTPWYLLFNSWQEPRPGFLIEHTHRLAGWIVGFLVVVLAAGMWTKARTCGLKKLGLACFAGVGMQGLLGGYRVVLHDLIGLDLAVIHGCFAQIVFCLLVSTAVLTAPQPPRPEPTDDERRRLRRSALLLSSIAVVQLIWGALVRHDPSPLTQRLHLMTAFAVVAAGAWAIKIAQGSPALWVRLRRPCTLLAIFFVLQIVLGAEAWMGKFASGQLPELQKITAGLAVVRIAHVMIGAGILATSFSLVLLLRRSDCPSALADQAPNRKMADEAGSQPALAGSPLGGSL
jgi:heme a synthase